MVSVSSMEDFTMEEWSKENISKLIELFREHPLLWDSTHFDFKMRNKKLDAWNEIAAEMGLDRSVVEKKIRCLIGQYQRNVKKLKSGSGAEDREPKWPFFNSLHFLKDKSKPRNFSETGGFNECSQNSQDEDQQESEEPVDTTEPGEAAAPAPIVETVLPKKRKTVQMAEEAFNVMKQVSASLNEENDEFDAFGKHVACQVRNLTSKVDQAQAKFKINQLLYQLEMNQLQDVTRPISRSFTTPSTASTSTSYNNSHVEEYLESNFGNNEDDQLSVFQQL